jgi:CRP-like cAMP-binding protein
MRNCLQKRVAPAHGPGPSGKTRTFGRLILDLSPIARLRPIVRASAKRPSPKQPTIQGCKQLIDGISDFDNLKDRRKAYPLPRPVPCGRLVEPGDAAAGEPQTDLRVRHFSRGAGIYDQGDSASFVYNLVTGWVGLHQDMADGRRQIGKFLIRGALFGLEPGDIPHGQGATAITDTSICLIPVARFQEMRRHNAAFGERLLVTLECENHLAAEALTAMGQGTAIERVARILCELAVRLTSHGFTDVAIEIPLTQRLIADAAGLTAIHVNRILRRLRLQCLVELQDGVMIVKDLRRLVSLAGVSNGLLKLWRQDAANAWALHRMGRPAPAVWSAGSAIGSQQASSAA